MMVNGVCLQAQGRDAAKSGDGICIDSSANRVCLQAQNAMWPEVKKARVSWMGDGEQEDWLVLRSGME